MKKFKLCLLSLGACALMLLASGCPHPVNPNDPDNESTQENEQEQNQNVAIYFKIGSEGLNGTFSSERPAELKDIYYFTFTEDKTWEFGQKSTGSITNNSNGEVTSTSLNIPFYKGTFVENEDGTIVLTKTHDGSNLFTWTANKVENWKTVEFNEKKTVIKIEFAASELNPFEKKEAATNAEDEEDFDTSIVFPMEDVYSSSNLEGECKSLTVNKEASDKYYMSFTSGWTSGSWELGINSTDDKGVAVKTPLYKGTYKINGTSGIIIGEEPNKTVDFSVTHVYEVNDWVEYKVNKWRTGTFNKKATKLGIKFNSSELVPLAEEITKNNKLVEAEIKALTESGSYVLNKRCQLSAVKNGLDALKESKPDVMVDLDLSAFTNSKIAANTFSNCTNIKSVILPDGLTGIDNSAFEDCTGLEKITLPQKLEYVASSAFTACSKLANVYYKGSLEDWCKKNWCKNTSSDSYYSSTSYEIFQTAYDLYITNEKLEEVTIPDTVTKLTDYLFANCKSLTKVTLPASVTAIEKGAFEKCSNLETIEIPSSVIKIYNEASSSYAAAFEDCSKLANIYYKGSLRNWCTADTYNSTSKSWNASVFPAAYDLYIDNKKITDLNEDLLENVTSICSSAFENCKSLTSVTLPSTITDVGSNAFKGCTGITSAAVSVTSFNSSSSYFNSSDMFADCSSLTSVSVNQIALNYFSSIFDNYITSVVIQEGVISIGYHSFCDYTNLESVTVPSSVKSVDSNAFSGCSALASVYYGGTLEDWCTCESSNNSYGYDESSNKKTWSASVFSSPYDLYIGEQKVTELKADSFTNIASLCENAFKNCKSLTSVTIPSSVTEIRSYTFSGCTALTSVTIPASVTKICSYAFQSCDALTEIVFEDTVSKWYKTYGSYGPYYDYDTNKTMSEDAEENANLLVNEEYYYYFFNENYTSD